MSLKKSIKPPLGLTPRWIRDEERRVEIKDAFDRYCEGCESVPKDWIDELNEILTRLKKRKR